MKKCIPTCWLRSEVVWVQRKILPLLGRDENLLLLTKALWSLAQEFLPESSLFEAAEISPMSKVGTAADPGGFSSLNICISEILHNTIPGSTHLKKKPKQPLPRVGSLKVDVLPPQWNNSK